MMLSGSTGFTATESSLACRVAGEVVAWTSSMDEPKPGTFAPGFVDEGVTHPASSGSDSSASATTGKVLMASLAGHAGGALKRIPALERAKGEARGAKRKG